MVATTEAYAKINHFEMAAGRFLRDGENPVDEGDGQRLRNVVVLGSGVARELFPFEEALGQGVVINKSEYIVVGVVKDRLPRGSKGEKSRKRTTTWTFICRSVLAGSALASASCFDRVPAS